MSNELPPPLKTTSGGPGPSIAWLMLSFDGRISRQVYWLGLGLLFCVLSVVVGFFAEDLAQQAALNPEAAEEATSDMLLILMLPMIWTQTALLIKRQHDRGLPWFWCLLAFVPIAGVAWLILAGLLEGDTGPNSYGLRPNAPSGST